MVGNFIKATRLYCGNTTILSDTVTGYAFCAVNDFIGLIRPIFVIADPKK